MKEPTPDQGTGILARARELEERGIEVSPTHGAWLARERLRLDELLQEDEREEREPEPEPRSRYDEIRASLRPLEDRLAIAERLRRRR